MSEPLIIRVRNALSGVINPATGRNIVAEGAVQGLSADANGKVRFALQVDPAVLTEPEKLLAAAREAVAGLAGVSAVSAVATAHADQPSAPSRPTGGHANPLGLQKTAPNKKKRIEEAGETLSGVKHVIAVASGKGGVGKSTIAANLAVTLAAKGLNVGLMDADVYGPSLPLLLGLSERPPMRDGKIVPPRAFGVSAMSMGLMVSEAQSLAWRGPMVMGAVRQLMSDVDWGELDILLIDTPPGTGDAHLSLIQSKRLSGAVIVSTPQEMALADVRRGVQLFRKTETPIIGVIENMAWLENSNGERQYLFGQGGAERAAAELDAPFLGAVPLYPELRVASDQGEPLALSDHPSAAVFKALAGSILGSVSV